MSEKSNDFCTIAGGMKARVGDSVFFTCDDPSHQDFGLLITGEVIGWEGIRSSFNDDIKLVVMIAETNRKTGEFLVNAGEWAVDPSRVYHYLVAETRRRVDGLWGTGRISDCELATIICGAETHGNTEADYELNAYSRVLDWVARVKILGGRASKYVPPGAQNPYKTS